MDKMTYIRFTDFLLFLLLNQVCSEEPKLEFRAKDDNFLLGYCFGVDYIAAYEYGPKGYHLLGNSSELTNISQALHDRFYITKDSFLLGLQINDLKESDSGLYRRECWKNHSIVREDAVQLLVCREEFSSKMIIVNEDGGAELLCNSPLIGMDNISVRWYHEIFPADKPVLFLDTTISQDPLLKELQGVVEARDNGSLLVLDKTVIQKNIQFYCLVINDGVCLSFQNMYLASHSESRDIYVSQGEKVVLNCPAEKDDQQWETPLGEIDNNSTRNNQMYISAGNTEDFSLIIPDVSDEHSGMYSCISPSSEIQYSLTLCSKTRSQEKVAYEGENVSLDCNFEQKYSKRVLWYRSQYYEVLSDSENDSVPDLGDLRGRLAPSNSEDLLTISELDMNDTGVYGCLVFKNPEYMQGGWDYDYYDEEGMTTDEYGDDEYFGEMCILKHETILKVFNREESPESSQITGLAVGAALLGLIVVSVVIVIAVKRRQAASVTHSDIQMNVDPGCTISLTGNDDVA